ncbi:hypothetical protein C8R47DRAFT_1161919 [Mycena vitilis]|nr:hypothetical protein C8R47DRAFT_1161919 [Mycena vitilis]
MELLNPGEITMLKQLIASKPGMQVTPEVAIAFIAEKAKHTPLQRPPMEEQELDDRVPSAAAF